MNDEERRKEIAFMCREILDTDEPFYRNYELTEREKDNTIDLLLRVVLGFTEKDVTGEHPDLDYAEKKFYGAYKYITGKNPTNSGVFDCGRHLLNGRL
jgi:hypothetical protein